MNDAKHYAQMFAALQRIKAYQSPARLKNNAWKEWGLQDASEAIEMAYENVIEEAKAGLKGVRRPTLEKKPDSVAGIIGAGAS